MPKVSPIQSNFGGGEYSPKVYGRVDADRYKLGLATCQNYIPAVQGGLARRSGSVHIAETFRNDNSLADLVKLVPFRFSQTQAYAVEIGDSYIKFYKDRGLITEASQSFTSSLGNVITKVGHGYLTGNYIAISNSNLVELSNRIFRIVKIDNDNFSLLDMDGNAIDTSYWLTQSGSGGTMAKVYLISNDYDSADIPDIQHTQSVDVLYLVHPDYPPAKLTRTAHTSWTLTDIDFLDGPYLPQNPTLVSNPSSPTTLTPGSFAVGTGVTLTASAVAGINDGAGFAVTDIGRLIRIQQGSTWGWVKITGWTSTTVVTVEIKSTLTNTNPKSVWRMGLWSETTGYPSTVVFHEDRLIFGGAAAKPQQIDGSQTSDYENFAPSDTGGTTSSTTAIQFNLNSNDVNVIRWMTSDEKGLCVGTLGGEWILKTGSQADALAQNNPPIVKQATAYGSANIQPLKVGRSTIFVQSTSRNLREMTYFFDVDGFRCPDLTQLSEHITGEGVTQLGYQKEPATVWAVREDGKLLSMTYEREADSFKVGWGRHVLGGQGRSYGGDPIVESLCVIPEPNGTYDDVYLLVTRWINGRNYRSVEYLSKTFDSRAELEEANFVDCGLITNFPLNFTTEFDPGTMSPSDPVKLTSVGHFLATGNQVRIRVVNGNFFNDLQGETYTVTVSGADFTLDGTTWADFVDDVTEYTYGSGTCDYLQTTVYGLNHLEGEAVKILADGYEVIGKTVANGSVSFDNPVGYIVIGYGYNSDAQMLRIDAGAADGTSLGKTRRTHRVGFLLERTLGLKIGMSLDSLTDINFRTASDPLSSAVPLYSGIKSKTIDATYDFENQIAWRQDGPFPGMILAVLPQMVTQDR